MNMLGEKALAPGPRVQAEAAKIFGNRTPDQFVADMVHGDGAEAAVVHLYAVALGRRVWLVDTTLGWGFDGTAVSRDSIEQYGRDEWPTLQILLFTPPLSGLAADLGHYDVVDELVEQVEEEKKGAVVRTRVSALEGVRGDREEAVRGALQSLQQASVVTALRQELRDVRTQLTSLASLQSSPRGPTPVQPPRAPAVPSGAAASAGTSAASAAARPGSSSSPQVVAASAPVPASRLSLG